MPSDCHILTNVEYRQRCESRNFETLKFQRIQWLEGNSINYIIRDLKLSFISKIKTVFKSVAFKIKILAEKIFFKQNLIRNLNIWNTQTCCCSRFKWRQGLLAFISAETSSCGTWAKAQPSVCLCYAKDELNWKMKNEKYRPIWRTNLKNQNGTKMKDSSHSNGPPKWVIMKLFHRPLVWTCRWHLS